MAIRSRFPLIVIFSIIGVVVERLDVFEERKNITARKSAIEGGRPGGGLSFCGARYESSAPYLATLLNVTLGCKGVKNITAPKNANKVDRRGRGIPMRGAPPYVSSAP